MNVQVVCTILLVGLSLASAQLTGTPPNCVSYRWDNKPIPPEVYECETFSDFLRFDKADGGSKSLTLDFPGLKSVSYLDIKNTDKLEKVSFPVLKAVKTINFKSNRAMNTIDFRSLQQAATLSLKNMTAMQTVNLNALETVGEFHHEEVGTVNVTLPVLVSVTNYIWFGACPNLRSVRLPMLQHNSGPAWIIHNPQLFEVQAPEWLDSLTVRVSNNAKLYQFYAPKLRTVKLNVIFEENGELLNINLSHLESNADQTLEIRNNAVLRNIFLPRLEAPSKSVEITGNPALRNILIDSLTGTEDFRVESNLQLYSAQFHELQTVTKAWRFQAATLEHVDSHFLSLKLGATVPCALGVPNTCCSEAKTFVMRINRPDCPTTCRSDC